MAIPNKDILVREVKNLAQEMTDFCVHEEACEEAFELVNRLRCLVDMDEVLNEDYTLSILVPAGSVNFIKDEDTVKIQMGDGTIKEYDIES